MTGGWREEETQVRGEGRDADVEVGLGGGRDEMRGPEEEGVGKGAGAKEEVQTKGQGLRRIPEGRAEQTGAWGWEGAAAGLGAEAGGRRRARGPLYQAAQIVLQRLDRERGGPSQRPASEVDAAAQMQVLGPADGRRSGQGARIHHFGHGSGESRSTPIGTPRHSDG